MTQKRLEWFLEHELGLSTQAIGRDTVARAINAHKRACGLEEVGDYFEHLVTSLQARDQLMARVVVPETWFFRNRKSFDFMTHYVKTQWQPAHPKSAQALRILSVPCSSGEEPYSAAMALLDGKVPPKRFSIDGVDISERLLQRAEGAVYGRESFRGADLSFQDRYFEPGGSGYRLGSKVRRMVRFTKGNILDDRFMAGEPGYDIVFCRNLLIYLNASGKKTVFAVIDRLLKTDGILFLGHAEREIATKYGFIPIPSPGVFACRRAPRHAEPPQPKGGEGRLPPLRLLQKAVEPIQAAPADQGAQGPSPAGKPQEGDGVLHEEHVLFDRVKELADEGSLSSACTLCQEFLQKNPSHIQANFLMGLIHEALEENDRAEAFFNKTLYLDPSHHDAMTHLAFIVEKQGHPDKASHLRKRALRVYREQQTDPRG